MNQGGGMLTKDIFQIYALCAFQTRANVHTSAESTNKCGKNSTEL